MAESHNPQHEALLAGFVHRPLPAALDGLADLALDLRWLSSPLSNRIWEMLDPDAWERTQNPFMILQNVSQARLEEAAGNEEIKAELRRWLDKRDRSLPEPGWFGQNHADSDLKSIAYFSMEFGLSESLPIYSGGLGMLAGDHLKTASDMGVPITGVGLLYQQGYFRQILDSDGWQLEAFPYNDPTSLPITPAEKPEGGWLRIELELPGRNLILRVWQARVGRVDLYLLDSNDPLNSAWDRGITATLYPSGQEKGQERRLIQEIVLGIGGWRALEALGIEIDVCHLNEGHAAAVVLARALSFMRKTKLSFDEALWATRAGNVFTTHTAVPAGFDHFDSDLVRQYADRYTRMAGISVEELLDLGREQPGSGETRSNIAYLAMRGCDRINGVSRLHEQVSKNLFQPLYPRWPHVEVPVGHVTNGVHAPTWESPVAHDFWNKVCGEDQRIGGTITPCAAFDTVSDTQLWEFRTAARRSLIDYVRRRLARQVREHGASDDAIQRAQHVLDPNALTLGFARRFTEYKRPNLLLYDPDRFARLLLHPEQPLQLIVAGKAHPQDEQGKRMVQAMARFASRPDLSDRVIFLEDYDIALMQRLAEGVDVWINTPRRPWEACGTSGMKLLINGGLNLSVLDGWWAEAYSPEVGWALGEGRDDSEPGADAREAIELYEILERQIVPEFYRRDTQGTPVFWIGQVRASMSKLVAAFSSQRMLQQYVEEVYLPAAAAYRRRTADGAKIAVELNRWHTDLAENWKDLRFGEMRVMPGKDQWRFEVQVYFGNLQPDLVRVELYADPANDAIPVRVEMTQTQAISDSGNAYLYTALVPISRPSSEYTPRIIPFHPEALVPLEDTHILWQR